MSARSPSGPLGPLPSSFPATREALRTLACYVIAPARKAREGRIGLRPTGDGFGTPVLSDRSRIVVRGDRLERDGESAPITTLAAAAAQIGGELVADPGVGSDLPPFDPAAALGVDAEASRALGRWYALGQVVIDRLTGARPDETWAEAQLWPEHFDLATVIELAGGRTTNVGFSPGDGFHSQPYVYVGPHDTTGLVDPYWNAPFGAVLGYDRLLDAPSPSDLAAAFIEHGLSLLSSS